jgi:hypothetical protein
MHPEADEQAADEVVVEVAVRRADADAAVTKLRADGHRILRVREPAGVPAPAVADPGAGREPGNAGRPR